MEPSPLGSLKGLNGTKDTRFIFVRPLAVKVKAYDPVLGGIAYALIMNLAAKSRATSSPIALRLSSLNRRRNCLTGLNFGSILRVCSASSLGTPGMSEGFHAKMSRFSRMNSMSALSYLGSRLALMLNCLYESPGVKLTSFVLATDLNFNAGSCSVVGFLREVISAGSTLC